MSCKCRCKTVAGWAIACILLIMEITLAFGQEPAPAPEFALSSEHTRVIQLYGGARIKQRNMVRFC